MVIIKRLGRALTACSLAAGLGCSGLLDVSDPSAFTDGDLDQALDAVARGVEGALHERVDTYVTTDNLISDVWQHTGTWSQYDDTDHGRLDYNSSHSEDGGRTLLRARYAAQDAARRFQRLEGEGQTVDAEWWAQIRTSEGWLDILIAERYCESVGDAVVSEAGEIVEYGALRSDTEMWQQGLAKLRDALPLDPGSDFAVWAEAGIARAELMLGNLDAANTAAGNVLANAPAGWQKLAQYQQATQENAIVNLNTIGFNNAAGMREKWWPLVDDAARLMADPWSLAHLALTELDPRVPIRHDAGVLGVDGATPYFSQWKYRDVGADIPITHLDEMRLIQAEVAMRQDRLTDARTILNDLRVVAGLSPAPDAMADELAEVQELLLNERFAELFMEGHRQNDLVRFGLIPTLMANGDFVGSVSSRTVKFPIDIAEARDNPNVEDAAASRCLPKASAAS